MTRRTYTSEYKAKLVIEVLQGEKELNTIAAENALFFLDIHKVCLRKAAFFVAKSLAEISPPIYAVLP